MSGGREWRVVVQPSDVRTLRERVRELEAVRDAAEAYLSLRDACDGTDANMLRVSEARCTLRDRLGALGKDGAR